MGDLIIGIGGTGGKVIRALRNRIRQSRGKESDTNQYLCLDTMGYGYYLMEIYDRMNHKELFGQDTTEDLSPDRLSGLIKNISSGEDLAVGQSEYLQFRGMDNATLDELIKDSQHKEGLYNWLQASGLKLQFGVKEKVFQFKEGAGQYRQIGRIGTFISARDINSRLEAIRQKSGKNDDGMTIHIICSLAGGTGSGNFIDIAVLAKSIFRNNDNSGSATISLLLLLDGAFGGDTTASSKSKNDMLVTTRAVMRELSRLQSAPTSSIPLKFNYENIQSFELENNVLFDQILIMDFEGKGMSEQQRRRTVYPTMAELVDLFSAPGTGPLVNQKLVNMNKRIRFAQASETRADDSASSMEHDATKDPFPPFFSTANTFRILFPKRTFQQKATANAILKFLDKLLPIDQSPVDANDFNKAFLILKRPSIDSIFSALIGKAKSTDFRPDENNPLFDYLERNESQLKFFNYLSEKELILASGVPGTYYKPAEDILRETDAQRDPALSIKVYNAMDNVRLTHFGVKSLDDFRNHGTVSLDAEGELPKALKQAIRDKEEEFTKEIFAWIESQLKENRHALRKVHKVLSTANLAFLRPMLKKIHERQALIEQNRETTVNQTINRKQIYQTQIKKSGEALQSSRSYIESERELFSESRRLLSNKAQIEFTNRIIKHLDQWIESIRNKVTLLHGATDDCIYRLTNKTIQAYESQLRDWAGSSNVWLGFKDSRSTQGDLSMGGFEEYLVSAEILNILNTEKVNWVLSDKDTSLKLIYDKNEIEEGLKGYYQLNETLFPLLETHFKDWTMYRYLWEYVCQRDEKQLRNVCDTIVDQLRNLKGNIQIDESSNTLASEWYIICADPSVDRGAQKLMELIDDTWRLTGQRHFQTILNEQAQYEFTLVRMDNGLTESNVIKLRECLEVYTNYVTNNSPILSLVHILPEEQSMVMREQHMRKLPDLKYHHLLPYYLAPIYANEQLTQLYLALFLLGFIDVPISNDPDYDKSYWCYMPLTTILNLLQRPAQERLNLLDELFQNPSKEIKFFFSLNPELPPAAQHTMQNHIRARRGGDGADFFVAMSRFTQRHKNARAKHAHMSDFPWNMNHINSLLKALASYWAMPDPQNPGQQMYEKIKIYIDHFNKAADELEKTEDRIWYNDQNWLDEWETQTALIKLRNAPLPRLHVVEFLRQTAIYLEKYSSLVRPEKIIKRARF